MKKITLLPFYWGFDIGTERLEPMTMYKMLTIIDKHADEFAKLDPSFAQIGGGKMAEFQGRRWSRRRPRPDPSWSRQVPEGKEHVGQQVGFHSRARCDARLAMRDDRTGRAPRAPAS